MATHEVTASLTGTVFKIEVVIGTAVEEGAPLIILESMKMEIPIESPSKGKVQSILVNEGDAVSEGQALILLENA